MRASTIVAGFGLSLLSAGVIAACNKQPSPTGPSQEQTVVRIEGPATVAPGQSAQFTVALGLPTGLTRDVTSDARWSSTNPSVLSVSASGLVTAHQLGEVDLSVSVPRANQSSLSSVRNVLAIPSGTYRLAGVVRDTELRPLSAARVEVLGGPAIGQVATTLNDGQYRLYGVSGSTSIRVTRSGYLAHEQAVVVNDHLTLDVGLTFHRPEFDFSGTYTLRITAADKCAASLPEAARSRTYAAVVTQNKEMVDVMLSGAKFAIDRGGGDRFVGRVENGRVHFFINVDPGYPYGYYGDTSVYEEFPPGYLVLAGRAFSSITSTGLSSGELFGLIQLVDDRRTTPFDIGLRCSTRYESQGQGHRFVFSR